MTKEEFVEKAKELNYDDKLINGYIKVAKDIAGDDEDFDYGIFPLFYQEPGYLKG